MTKTINMFLFLILVSSFSFLVSPLNAQTPTNTTGDDIQKFREVIQQKVKEKLQEISQDKTILNPKKAYLGTITEINDNLLKIDSKTKIYEFTISDDATFVNLKQTRIKKTDLKVGQDVLVLSLTKDTITLAKKIIIVDPSKLTNNKNVTLGKIADISPTTSVLVLIPTNNKNRELQIKTDTKTEIIDKNNKTIKFSDLKKGQKIVCVYTNSQNATYPAQKIIALD
ncbi:MAG TPA: hypothetical protein VN174_03785 [Candidatus Methanoperedens sp.]|nr:hypothetical protein [Candidatus Methanoperedens sp.]